MYSKDSPQVTLSNIAFLEVSAQVFGGEDPSPLEKLATFGKKNPRDGASFIAYTNQIIPRFHHANEIEVLDALIKSYYRYFDNIELQKRITEMFLPLLPKFEGQYQAKALETYYKMYLEKNSARESQIEQIDYRYRRDLQGAESILHGKRAAKAEHRYRGVMGIAAGIVLVAVIALFLVLLSIQRNVREIGARGG